MQESRAVEVKYIECFIDDLAWCQLWRDCSSTYMVLSHSAQRVSAVETWQ
jgi:hypothetical protein